MRQAVGRRSRRHGGHRCPPVIRGTLIVAARLFESRRQASIGNRLGTAPAPAAARSRPAPCRWRPAPPRSLPGNRGTRRPACGRVLYSARASLRLAGAEVSARENFASLRRCQGRPARPPRESRRRDRYRCCRSPRRHVAPPSSPRWSAPSRAASRSGLAAPPSRISAG